MDIEISAAVSKNGFIDIEGVRYSEEDKRRIRERIEDMAVIISRGTYEKALELRGGQPFVCKRILVVSSIGSLIFPECEVVPSLTAALKRLSSEKKVMIFGGNELYAESLEYPETSTIYLTEIDVEYSGKVRFPEIDTSCWKLVVSERHKGSPAVTFKTFKRPCPLCLSHPRMFFGRPVKEEVFWDFYFHRERYIAVYKKTHAPQTLSKEAQQELGDFIMWLKFDHKVGWIDHSRVLYFEHAHCFFGWHSI